MRLNSVYEFDDVRRAVLFAREKAQGYEEEGLIVDHFNGHDWVWYATDISKGDDKGILLQIFCKESHNGDVVIPSEEYNLDAA